MDEGIMSYPYIHESVRLIQSIIPLPAQVALHVGQTFYDWMRSEPNSLPDSNTEADNRAPESSRPDMDTEQPNGCMRCQCDTCTCNVNKLNNLEKENQELKHQMAAMVERMEALEERNTGFNGLPLVVTTMAGFDNGDMLGKGK